MRSSSKKPDVTSRKARTVRPAANRKAGDISSRRFAALGNKLGNQGIDEKVKSADGQARALLEFISQRLHILQGVQHKELLEMKDFEKWRRAVAKGQSGFELPDTNRWHESAKLFLQAAQAISNGNLGRGADLLDQALEAERAAFESVPRQVRENFEVEESAAEAPPPGTWLLSSAALCPRQVLPAGIRKASAEVLNLTNRTESVPPLDEFHWFDEKGPEEEEEEDDDEGDD